MENILLQEFFFGEVRDKIKNFNRKDLTPDQKVEYDLISYFGKLHSERIALEKAWSPLKPDVLSLEGLKNIPLGKKWYEHFLHRWIDLQADPDELFAFGLKEIEKVKKCIKQVQIRSGYSESEFNDFIESDTFYIEDPAAIKEAFFAFDLKIQPMLPDYFPAIKSIPEVAIREGDINDLAQVPGYYRNNTFYYNHFGKPFNNRQVKWLYMHEANPGHHYEVSLRNDVMKSPLQNIFRSLGYSEGWAAYVEEIGYEIGAYENIYDELGKWEWDIIRSVRVPLDVGLNYYGWSDDKALEFWKKHIHQKDDIGLREIARMKRWPCQVITYKYGADKILQWKAKLIRDKNLTLFEFHKKLLQYGPLPFSVLENYILNDLN